MAEPEKQKRSHGKDLLIGAGVVAGGAAAAQVLERHLSQKAKERSLAQQPVASRQQTRLERRRTEHRDFTRAEREAKKHPGQRWAERQYEQNPAEFRKQVKGQRLARRAKQASRRLGALGLVLGAPGIIGTAMDVGREGGSFGARFGKFVEEILGVTPGISGRPMTEAEKKRALSI